MGFLSNIVGFRDRTRHQTFVAIGLGALVIYLGCLGPLARFLGPKLAALTYWTEAYYELLHGEGGQFLFKYHGLHEKYGPIIRINPRELHIQDASFYETFYAPSKPTSKLKDLADRLNMPASAFSTPDPHMYRIRHDTIVEYCFEGRYDFIQEPNFKAPFVATFVDLVEPTHWVMQFPWMLKSMQMLLDTVMCWLNPRMKNVIKFISCKEALNNAQEKGPKGQRPDTIFTSIIQSDFPRSEVTAERLQHEAISIVGAGIETTMYTLALSVFHITNNPWVSQRLREELLAAIREDDPLVYGDSIIPKGTVVSMDIYGVSHDETIFPESHTYNLARWPGTTRTPDGRQLTRCMVLFMRGPRSCVGMQLAYAELYIGLATLFRRFEFELFETDQSDVDLMREYLVPKAKASSKGVRVFVK
ncbi:cytochrome P450 [Aspergillus oleicola]